MVNMTLTFQTQKNLLKSEHFAVLRDKWGHIFKLCNFVTNIYMYKSLNDQSFS